MRSMYFDLTARRLGVLLAAVVWTPRGTPRSMGRTTGGLQILVLSNRGATSPAGLRSFWESIRLRGTIWAKQYYRPQATRALPPAAKGYFLTAWPFNGLGTT